MVLLYAWLLHYARFYLSKYIKRLVRKELHFEINKEYSERIIRLSLLNISFSFSLFSFILFLGFKDSYSGILDLFSFNDFTAERWHLIQISMVSSPPSEPPLEKNGLDCPHRNYHPENILQLQEENHQTLYPILF